ncbi:NAD-P-binding protein [Stereum hirsutum FP-91666 SS1]|uniref:NAD-P-binding protein n=1 Tax=Stereum hirsutum (strain FP-91666) TaxID=721885 RepID=UPI000440FE71|nr:NAD-P-binding protein [Stereum hirsutum FP-91666 SS1]EIM88915.1 NAD-P-binding protein [Stereum hirsutum FP-91666 SS1]
MSVPVEDLPVTRENDVYPGIDPKPHFEGQTYAGKVVLVTGASRGIGSEIALYYARAGASLALLSRTQAVLDKTKAHILEAAPKAQITTFVADVVDTQAIKAAVDGTVKTFGKIDIVVANAGKADPWKKPFTEYDPDNWWKTVEVNVRGVYNVAHFSLPHLGATSGYFLVIGSIGAQMRMPFASSYVLSKHAVNRLVEYIKTENPNVKTFSLNPGAIKTDMADNNPEAAPWLIDTLQLPAATALRVTSGKEDWLNGKYLSANWNLDEVEQKWKEKIIAEDALVNRLHVPV